LKKDAIPGFVNEIWARVETAGVYRGQCAELCGKDHGFMPIVLVAKTQEDYDKWVGEQRLAQAAERAAAAREWGKDELIAKGADVYSSNCASCHMPDGAGVPESFPPIRGSDIASGPIEAHLALVLHGRPGTSMMAFAPRLSDTEVAAVVTYQRNAFGNTSGDSLQPADVRAARSL
jgi:cytochrome c oxidase subunit 2